MPKAGNRVSNAEKLTNRQVITYYAHCCNKKCPQTEEYLGELRSNKTLEKHKGDYIDLAYSFMFFRWLYGCDGELKPKRPKWLIKIAPDLDLNVSDEADFYDLEFQKWHLIVSWYAYSQFQIEKEIGNKREKLQGEELLDSDAQGPCGILKSTVTCSELLLWMYEAAGGKDTCEKIKNLKCIEAETAVNIRQSRKSGWAKEIKDKIASLLKEQCRSCKSSDFCEAMQ